MKEFISLKSYTSQLFYFSTKPYLGTRKCCFWGILLFLSFLSVSIAKAQIFVSTEGKDTNPGTQQAPKATLRSALRQVREIRRLDHFDKNKPLKIILKGGIYTLDEPLFIRPEDAGTKKAPTYIEGAPGEQAVLSGGIPIKNWKRLKKVIPGLPEKAVGKVWVADLPKAFYAMPPIRQLWVNKQKATKARWPNKGDMKQIIGWDHKTQTCDIPFSNNQIEDFKGVELFIKQRWEIAILRIKNVKKKSDTGLRVSFREPEGRIQSEHPWPAPWISEDTGNSPFYLTNSIAFLDEPGEWFYDIKNHKLYYWPRPSEKINSISIVAPILENLVQIKGTIDDPVKNIHFKNISFQYATWNRPTYKGHVPHQAGMPMTDAYKLKPSGVRDRDELENQAWVVRPEAAVRISFAKNTSFEDCSFLHLASTALDYNIGVKNNLIKGNLFKDIGGSGILMGVFSPPGFEIHRLYKPKDQRVVADSNRITNNFLTNIANEDWGSVGIGLGYTRNSLIAHNEIENVSYSGISMGWGWNPRKNVMSNNKVTANRIHHFGKHDYDCAGIYTLSAQPGSIISKNYIDSAYKAPYPHAPAFWFYLYTDEGSAGITLKDNWTPSKKYLSNHEGPGNVWENNGHQVDQIIKQKAGLRSDYKHLQKERTSGRVTEKIDKKHKQLIELTVKNKEFDINKLRSFLREKEIKPQTLYRWKNHIVIFADIWNVLGLLGNLRKEFPDVEAKSFYNQFYRFDRSSCKVPSTAEDVKYIIMTANLIDNPQKQQEYLAYHATQHQKWPEVSKGFCRADFQKLYLFHNGRQLMLVIGIPKDKTLYELNPKTEKNNPQMVKWNKMMAPYQENVEGNKKGDTWVTFKKIPLGTKTK